MNTLIQPLVVGSRASRLRASHSYGTVLGLIVALFLCSAVFPDESWSGSALLLGYCATLVTARWTSGIAPWHSGMSISLTAVAAAVAVVQLLTGGDRLAGAVALLTGVLIASTVIVIALGVMDQREVNAQSVQGAICVYLLIGMMFVFLYGAFAHLGEGDFFVQGTDGTRALRVYFSFVTLATLGYGDYTAAGDLGRTVSVLEALVGQLYLVIVVALLVSRIRPGQGHAPADLLSSRGDDAAPRERI